MHTNFRFSGSSPHLVRLKSLIILLTMMTFSFSLVAQKAPVQTIKVSGKITGQDNQVVPGANVMIKGTTVGTTTNASGDFSINAPSNGTLNISSVGMTTQQIAIGDAQKSIFHYLKISQPLMKSWWLAMVLQANEICRGLKRTLRKLN